MMHTATLKRINPLRLMFLISFILLVLQPGDLHAQACGQLNLQEISDIPSDCQHITMTMKQDRLDRPYLYVAAKEGGLRVYDLLNINMPILVDELPISLWNDLHVMSVQQEGEYLYLTLGSHFLTGQNPGIAIVNVQKPDSVYLTDYWMHSEPNGGAGSIAVGGDYAYLAAMEDGVFVFDISNKTNIQEVSQIVPDIGFPEPNPDASKYNARGLVLRDDVLYLAYDAGGFRIINVSNKSQPVETGRYSNLDFNGYPRAYNNLVLQDSLVYIAIDYCGMEILNVADTSQIELISWWNPWDCLKNTTQWFTSPGHSNEIAYSPAGDWIFLSTGKSDMHVVDVSDPYQPDSCDIFGGINNQIGTWGIDVYKGHIYLSYICSFIPFSSNWTGVKILSFDEPTTSLDPSQSALTQFYPNPTRDFVQIQWDAAALGPKAWISLQNQQGQTLYRGRYQLSGEAIRLDLRPFSQGMYFVRLETDKAIYVEKLLRL